MPCRFPGLHSRGKVEGSGQGGISRPTPGGVSPGPHLGGPALGAVGGLLQGEPVLGGVETPL